MRKYGVSITKLLSTAGPDLLVREIEAGLDREVHGDVGLHFYPFGGLRQTAEWLQSFYGLPRIAR
jgi:methylenetetrahydrofolate reductase (NADPH)